ncbi:hypothetical protein [Streptomyces lunaelactis]|uniref:hypothetical protein n=1 Tax=Streptomyces lunaelactis TaxID=1535768 RepID=UPI001584F67C|nr:hypothetical protein [Streptomyces lunaelactis]NUK22029.1 hypothetical protein [Streptomyces lunaelactis]
MSADPTFRQAVATVLAELTPQPWDYTDGSGATLTVIPAGLREDYGRAEVMIRAAASKTEAAELGIKSSGLPGLLAALDEGTVWSHVTSLDDQLTVTPDAAGLLLVVTDVVYDSAIRERTATVHLPEEQRMPLASALRRALDVARGWEDPPVCAECDAEVEPGVTWCSTRCRNAADRHDLPEVSGE